MRRGGVCTVLTALLTMLGACSAPTPAPGPTTSAGPPSPTAGPDPCELITTEQATRLGLHAPARTGATECAWSTTFGSAIGVHLEQHAHTVQEFVDAERQKQRAANLTVSPWTGQHHQGATLDWGDGHGYGVVITVSPTRIATVLANDSGEELGRPIPDVVGDVAAVVDGNLPA